MTESVELEEEEWDLVLTGLKEASVSFSEWPWDDVQQRADDVRGLRKKIEGQLADEVTVHQALKGVWFDCPGCGELIQLEREFTDIDGLDSATLNHHLCGWEAHYKEYEFDEVIE